MKNSFKVSFRPVECLAALIFIGGSYVILPFRVQAAAKTDRRVRVEVSSCRAQPYLVKRKQGPGASEILLLDLSQRDI